MNSSLKGLRRKYILTASVIVFFVILLMIVILNFLMRIAYRNEKNMIESVIGQAAVTRMDKPNTEHFNLNEAEQTKEGDYIIPRCIRDVSTITVYGSIENTGAAAVWYSAGGGLMFEAQTDKGIQMVYKDYSFSRDTTNVSIDFNSLDNLKCDVTPLSIEESQIKSNFFLVSRVWWRNSSNDDPDENIHLRIDSIDIHYKDSTSISMYSQSMIPHSSFADVFGNNVPETLNNTGAFYLIADKSGKLISVNDGNLLRPIDNAAARNYAAQVIASGKDSGKIEKDGSVYSYHIRESQNRYVLIFVNDSFTATANGSLLWISLLVGGLVWLILFVLIVVVSGHVIKPVAQAMENQKQFISNASHELKTPITVISAAVDVISEKKGEDRWTECIREQAKKMKRLVSELLDLSRLLELRTARSSFTLCDISRTVENTLLSFEGPLFESGKPLQSEVEENIKLVCDENKIAQLVSIFMDNALKYSEGEIRFSLKKERENAVIRCSNPCACGIKTEKLFERFYREETEQEGFGLGLSIAQAIVQVHEGTITAAYDKGSLTFAVTLPTK